MKIKHIIALDISKKSTGVCVLKSAEGNISISELTSIRTQNPANYNKFYFMAAEDIRKQIGIILEGIPYSDITCVFEFPIFSDYMSELQFFITEVVLSELYQRKIDCVGFSTLFLKSFVRQSAFSKIPGTKPRKHLTKEQIEWVYGNCFYPLNSNQNIPDPAEIKNDDEYDALYLALLGSWIVLPFLDFERPEDFVTTYRFKKLEEFIQDPVATTILLRDPSWYGLQYRLNDPDERFVLKNINFSGEVMGKQFKSLRQSALKNKHLQTGSNFFYPFAKIHNINDALTFYLNSERDATIKYLTKKFQSRASYIAKQVDGMDKLRFGFNKKGLLFLRKPPLTLRKI